MKRKYCKRISLLLLSVFFCITTLPFTTISALAAPESEPDYQALADERKNLPIQSNQIENWPEGPAISAQSAILLEANTGVILYAKNIYEKAYPASTTKLMTCLLAAENAEIKETVTFSNDAVFSIERDSSNIGIDAGQAMPMEECLYGILVASANEVANAVAEHIAGSQDAFADMMNERARELGCENTHFVNAHGLYHDNHYTTAYDLALIGQAFFRNELLSKIGNTPSHHFVATADQPDDFTQRNKHKLITGEIAYDGIKGGKTGYTTQARQTLVTCAEKNGMKLICVVMKEETPDQFNDTVKLFDYGFANFTVTNVAEHETKYKIENANSFHTSYDIFGNSNPILSLNQDSYIILPKTINFEDLTSEISYDVEKETEVARIHYTYHDNYVGTATIDLATETYATNTQDTADFNANEIVTTPDGQKIVFINVKTVLIAILVIAAAFILIFIIRDIVMNYTILDSAKGKMRKRRSRRSRKRNRDKGPVFPSSRFNDFDL